MRTRELVASAAALALLAAGCASEAPSWVRSSAARYGPPVALPAPSTGGGMPLDQAIAERRSTRSFGAGALPEAVIGQLLWAAQGVTSPDGRRAVPSAGGLYPLELYAVTPTTVMHYLPDGHRAEVRASPDLRPRLEAAAFDQAAVGAAPDLLVVAAVPDRTRRKYGARADTYVDLEAGHAAENILLEAVALGLAAVPIGGLDPGRAARALALPADQHVLYLIPVGPR